jgi:hypothetical protein
MSVLLISKNRKVEENFSNGTWENILRLSHNFHPEISDWNGHHDNYEWSVEELKKMESTFKNLSELLGQFSENGGLVLC